VQGTDKLYERILDAHAKPGDKMEVYCLTNYLLVPEGLSKHVEAALVRAGAASVAEAIGAGDSSCLACLRSVWLCRTRALSSRTDVSGVSLVRDVRF